MPQLPRNSSKKHKMQSIITNITFKFNNSCLSQRKPQQKNDAEPSMTIIIEDNSIQ